MMALLVLYFILIQTRIIYGEIFNCDDEDICNDHTYSCDNGGNICLLSCETTGSCEDVTLKCNDKPCVLYCTKDSCQNVTVIKSDINSLYFYCGGEEDVQGLPLEDCNQMGNQIKVQIVNPTSQPTADPTAPTMQPTSDPTMDLTLDPTTDPTNDPSIDPTVDPTMNPTTDPTTNPTTEPTTESSTEPTTEPTIEPTVAANGGTTDHPTLSWFTESTTQSPNSPTNDTNDECDHDIFYCQDGANCDGNKFVCDNEDICILSCDKGSCRDVTIDDAKRLVVYCNNGGVCDGSTFKCDNDCIIQCKQGSSKNVKVITSHFRNVHCIGDTCDQVQVNGCNNLGEIRMRRSDGSAHCLTVGSLGRFPIIKHSLGLSEHNLVWQSVNDDNVVCPQFCYNRENKHITLEYHDEDYALEWDFSLLGIDRGNQVEQDEKNAKIDRTDGDDFNYEASMGSICGIVRNGDECCLEMNDVSDNGYERDGDVFNGYEAKFDCNRDNTNTKRIYFYHQRN